MTEKTDDLKDSLLISTFFLGDTCLGIDTLKIQEIIRVPVITTVPNAPAYILGITNLRGKIVTIIYLSQKMGLPFREISKASRIIIVEWEQESVGLLVDSVFEVFRVDKNKLSSTIPFIHGSTRDHFDGVYQVGEHLVAILNTGDVLTPEEEAH